ncbi:hypothetical protein [Methanosarcina sp. UBA289]|uniref:hypothetical protein n=1 Tax=Methanosarcina sp. UBA289 TaxID=1915574 RepID=UPI0025EB1B20|nr:hypothetical protein [Methanosarcina sp. UBA289]
MAIDIKNRDMGGREGSLNINGIKIQTPDYLPNQKDITSLIDSSFVNNSNFPNIDVGVYTQWIDKQTLLLISGNLDEYNKVKKSINSGLKPMKDAGVKRKLLHFEFGSDVETLSGQEVDILLQLQDDVGADVIEIPNLFSTEEYKTVLDRAYEWKHFEGIGKELMGIANEGFDINLLRNKTDIISCIGASLRRENRPLLFAIKNQLSPMNIWVHAFSVPRSFRVVNWDGTMSVLLNYYGIDTMNTGIAHPNSAKRFGIQMGCMTDKQKIEQSLESRYFNPVDYSTFKCKNIKNHLKLNTFCNCPICQNNSIDTILQDVDTVYANFRAHEVFSYKKESSNYQNEIGKNVSDDYFNSKKYAKEIAVLYGV